MAKLKKAKVTTGDAGVLTFAFTNGETLVIDPAKFPPEIQARAMSHGFKQKIGDSYAAAEDVEEAVSAATGVRDALMDNKWSVRGEGVESGVTMLVEALYRCTKGEGSTIETCAATIEEMDEEQVEGLRQLAPIKAELDAIRLERAQARAAKSRAAVGNQKLDLSSLRGE